MRKTTKLLPKASILPIKENETDDVYQMFQEIPAEENGATNHANGLNREDFDEFCKKMNEYSIANAAGKKEFPNGKVPQTMYIISNNKGTPVGFGKFRPYLNDACIRNRAGNFAYMIHKDFRRMGFGTAFLLFVLDQAQNMGLSEIEGTALKENKASCLLMEKHGGIFCKRKSVKGDAVYKFNIKNKIRG